MPDSTGRLTELDNAIIQSWWDKHWKAPVICPVCKTGDWSIAPHIVNVQRHAQDSLAPNTVAYPHILVTCKVCAHAMFFNAVQIGISPAYVPQPSQSALGLAALGTPPFGSLAPQSPLGGGGILSDLLKKR